MSCIDDVSEVLESRVELLPHQERALSLLRNGRILYGGTGSGKSITALAYYIKKEWPKDVYIITTAKKRDSLEWLGDAAKYGISTDMDRSVGGVITIDSWNSLPRYKEVEGAFFIFDEQRLVGHGAWVKSFLKIVRRNNWIVLSATPGDTWLDYAPVFIANGWYKNITDFKRQHVIYAPYVKFPKILRYVGEGKLIRQRNEVLVEMPYASHTTRYVNYLDVGWDREKVARVQKNRWHEEHERPLKDSAELWRYVRQIVNSDESRTEEILRLMKVHPRLIIFYNFDYELEILREIPNTLEYWQNPGEFRRIFAEWNGKRHDPLPDSDFWVYFVQYQAGAEGWNCTQTDAMVFYSLTYSYKNWLQCQGRIDRLDTKYSKLYYYVLRSDAAIDVLLMHSMSQKKDFNERKGIEEWLSGIS